MRPIHSRTPAIAVLGLSLTVLLGFVPTDAPAQRRTTRGKSSKTADRDAALEKALRKRTTKIQAKYCRDLERTITWAAGQGLKKEADGLVRTIRSIDPEYRKLESLAAKVEKAEAESDAAKLAKAQKSLEKRLKTANKKQGTELAKLAGACMKVGLFTKAFDMIHQVIRISPDDTKARKILGYRRDTKAKKWISKWEYDMRKKNFLTSEGWFEKKHRKDYEKGLRPYKGKWIPQERERQVRTRNEFAPYTVQTEHFEVQTNLGREKAQEFALRLEDYYEEFFRFYIGYYDQIAGARLLFNRPETKKRHVVILFPDHAKYLTHVKQEQGNDKTLRESAGFYSSSQRKSRFYWSEDQEATYRTLIHEVGHQLFAETKKTARGGSQGNNWVVEGIACYMETWKKVDGVWRPGLEIENPFLRRGKAVIAANPDWKLESFVKIDNQQFHKEHRGNNYALSAALCHFFMHYDDQRYKEDFVRFLSAYYEGKVSEDSLVEYIRPEGPGPAFDTLEKQLREYLADLKRPVDVDTSGDGQDEAAGS